MMTLIIACSGLGIAVVSLVIAVAVALYKPPPPPTDPKPICGCRHHASFHDDNGCHHVWYSDYGNREGECGCVKYIGPVAYDALP